MSVTFHQYNVTACTRHGSQYLWCPVGPLGCLAPAPGSDRLLMLFFDQGSLLINLI